jgi:7-cyano-7-deazaguanine synthase
MKGARAEDNSVLVLLSGGVDSSTVCLYLRERGFRVLPHFVFYGQRAAASEWKAARAVARRLKLEPPGSSDLSSLGRALDFGLTRGTTHGDDASFAERFRESFFPHRNLLLATCAAMHAASRGVSAIAIGVVGGAEVAYPDTTPAFIRRLRRLLRMSADVRVLAPFAGKTKDDVARFGWDRGFDYGLTYSCHARSGIHCGRCAGCIERDRTLSAYPPKRPTVYARPMEWVS